MRRSTGSGARRRSSSSQRWRCSRTPCRRGRRLGRRRRECRHGRRRRSLPHPRRLPHPACVLRLRHPRRRRRLPRRRRWWQRRDRGRATRSSSRTVRPVDGRASAIVRSTMSCAGPFSPMPMSSTPGAGGAPASPRACGAGCSPATRTDAVHPGATAGITSRCTIGCPWSSGVGTRWRTWPRCAGAVTPRCMRCRWPRRARCGSSRDGASEGEPCASRMVTGDDGQTAHRGDGRDRNTQPRPEPPAEIRSPGPRGASSGEPRSAEQRRGRLERRTVRSTRSILPPLESLLPEAPQPLEHRANADPRRVCALPDRPAFSKNAIHEDLPAHRGRLGVDAVSSGVSSGGWKLW